MASLGFQILSLFILINYGVNCDFFLSLLEFDANKIEYYHIFIVIRLGMAILIPYNQFGPR
jgi:hypothetical protein